MMSCVLSAVLDKEMSRDQFSIPSITLKKIRLHCDEFSSIRNIYDVAYRC